MVDIILGGSILGGIIITIIYNEREREEQKKELAIIWCVEKSTKMF